MNADFSKIHLLSVGVPKSKSTELIEEEEMGREETPVKPKPEPIKKDFAGLYILL